MMHTKGSHAWSAGDELLRWASEAGSGSWDRLRDACAYLSQKHALKRRPWTLASDLSALGHMDIDWKTRAWSVAPPTLNLVPGLGLCIVLTGSRPHHIDERFESATDDLEVFPFELQQDPSPAAKYAKCASVEVASRVSDRLGAHLVIDPGNTLASALRPVDEVIIELAPEPPLEEATRFDPDALRWSNDHRRKPGLYRIDLHGRPVHRRLDRYGNWEAIDLAAGQFLALQDRKGHSEPVIRWRPGASDRAASFEVRSELALPILAERAMTVSSGLVPGRKGDWRRYTNVEQSLALLIARAVRQDLRTVWEGD
jgi:hypothetical protein